MAASALASLLLFSLLAATSSARPCKTIFYFSATTTTTTTTTYYPFHSHPANPNPQIRRFNPRYVTFIFTSTAPKPFSGHRPALNFKSDPSSDANSHSSPAMTSSAFSPLKFYSSVSSSIRDRTADIMSVVGALLFGVGCGALTGAVMYFLYALFSPGRFDFDDASDDEEEDDVAAIKRKLGYVSIPAGTTDDLKEAAPPAKEVV